MTPGKSWSVCAASSNHSAFRFAQAGSSAGGPFGEHEGLAVRLRPGRERGQHLAQRTPCRWHAFGAGEPVVGIQRDPVDDVVTGIQRIRARPDRRRPKARRGDDPVPGDVGHAAVAENPDVVPPGRHELGGAAVVGLVRLVVQGQDDRAGEGADGIGVCPDGVVLAPGCQRRPGQFAPVQAPWADGQDRDAPAGDVRGHHSTGERVVPSGEDPVRVELAPDSVLEVIDRAGSVLTADRVDVGTEQHTLGRRQIRAADIADRGTQRRPPESDAARCGRGAARSRRDGNHQRKPKGRDQPRVRAWTVRTHHKAPHQSGTPPTMPRDAGRRGPIARSGARPARAAR